MNRKLTAFFFLFGTFWWMFTTAHATIVGDNNPNYAAMGVQTQGVFYRDASFDQPLIGAKVTLSGAQRFWRMFIQLSEGTDVSALSDFKLWKTSVNYFAPARATELTGGTLTIDERSIQFDLWQSGAGQNYELTSGDYLWITARVAPSASPGAEIDAEITALHINGMVCYVENESPTGCGTTYEFRRRIVPYYRMNSVGNWNDAYYDLVTEVIFFYVGCNTDGSLYYGWDGQQFTEETFRTALETVRDGRGDRPVRILLGLAHCASNLSVATSNSESRTRLVDELIEFVKDFGFDGVDIDWEYPTSAADWRGFEALVAELRPRLFALGGGKMVSMAMSNYKFSEAINTYGLGAAELKGLCQQLDAVNFMTYDSAGWEGHSPTWLHNQSKEVAQTYADVPSIKANIGLPFYTNTHYWSNGTSQLTWAQYGYAWVYNNYPEAVDATDVIDLSDGTRLSYNSIATIKSKAADLRNSGYGAMIWAYETDLSFEHPKSLARALASELRPGGASVDSSITSATQWAMMEEGNYTLNTDLTLGNDDWRPIDFSGTLDGNGHTITLTGGAAALKGTLTGSVSNLNVVVTGALSARGAVTDMAITDASIEDVTVVIQEEATITGANSTGGIVGELYTTLAEHTAHLKRCRVECAGTLTATGHGRIGGIVGNLNQEADTATDKVVQCQAELYATATLTAPSNSSYPAVGGLVGHCNKGGEGFSNNTVVLYDGATLSGASLLGAVAGGSTWGTLSGDSNNMLIRETSNQSYATTGAQQILEFTVNEVDQTSGYAYVTYRDIETDTIFRVRQAVLFSKSGFSLRLR